MENPFEQNLRSLLNKVSLDNNNACGDDDCCGPNEDYFGEEAKAQVIEIFNSLFTKVREEAFEEAAKVAENYKVQEFKTIASAIRNLKEVSS